MIVSKYTLKLFLPLIFIVSVGATLAYFITSQVIVAAGSVQVLENNQSFGYDYGGDNLDYYAMDNYLNPNSNFAAVYVAYQDLAGSLTGVSWGDGLESYQNMEYGCREVSLNFAVEVWYLNNPTYKNSGTLELFFSNPVSNMIASLVSYSNVDNANPISDIKCNYDEAGSDVIFVNMQNEADDLLYFASVVDDSLLDGSPSTYEGTDTWDEVDGDLHFNGAYLEAYDVDMAPGFNYPYSGDPSEWVIAALALNADTAVAPDVQVFLTDEGGYLSVSANDDNEVVTIELLEYNYFSDVWIPLQEAFLDLPPYGDSAPDGETGVINADFFPYGSWEVRLRAIDNEGTYWPSDTGTEAVEFDGTGISVTADDSAVTSIIFDAQDPSAARTITSMEYSLNNGSSWIPVEEANLEFPPYGDGNQEYTYIQNYQIPSGTWDIIFRATDNNAEIWPKNEVIKVYDFEGTAALSGEFFIDLSENFAQKYIMVNIYSDDGELIADSVEYRLDGEDWINVPFDDYYATQPHFNLYDIDIPIGVTNIDVRVFDEFGREWGPESLPVTIGAATQNTTIGTIEFESEIGKVIEDEDEYYGVFSYGDPAGRVRITSEEFADNGLGALTFDGPPISNGNPGYAQWDVDFSDGVVWDNFTRAWSYKTSANYYINFDYIWNDDGSATNQDCIQNNNMLYEYIYDPETDSNVWTPIYNLYENRDYGNYKEVSIRLQDLNSIRFTSCFETHADSTDGPGGYTIDNLQLVHRLFDVSEDPTDPILNLNIENPYISEYGTIANIIGNIQEDYTNILFAKYRYRGANSGDFSYFDDAVPSDGAFDSVYEDILVDARTGDEDLLLDVLITTKYREIMAYSAGTLFVDSTSAEVNFTSTPEAVSGKSITFSGTALDNESGIDTIDLVLLGGEVNIVSIYNSSEDPDFPSNSVDFSYTLLDLSLGEHEYELNVTNLVGMERSFGFVTTVVDANPILEVSNYPEDFTENTELEYTGSLQMTLTNIENVQFLVGGIGPGDIEIPLTDAIPDDGAFDSPYEEFHFTTPPLQDGLKRIFVQFEDEFGTVYFSPDYFSIGYEVDVVNIDAVDVTGPVIDLQPIVPNPTYDSTPLIFGKVQDYQFDHPSNIKQMWYQIIGYHTYGPKLDPLDGVYDEQTEEFYIESPELDLGTYTLYIRAEDEVGNITLSDPYEFTIEEQEENVISTKAIKSGDFLLHNDHDVISSSEEIWGRGRLRLQQYVNIANTTALSTDNYGVRYGYDPAFHAYTTESTCSNGSWQTKDNGNFSFWDLNTATEYNFNVSDEFGLNNNTVLGEIQDVLNENGNCNVWITAYDKLVAVDFGINILDGIDDYFIYDITNGGSYPGFGSSGNLFKLFIDTRSITNYGVYYRYGDAPTTGVGYIVPGSDLVDDSDDGYANYSTGSGYTLQSVTDMYLDGNVLWLLDYNNGVVKINDNGTPLNLGDDSAYQYTGITAYFNNFGITKNKSGNIVIAGDNGLWEIRENGDFDPSNDEAYQLLSTAQVENNVFTHLEYFPGDSIIGEQYFIGTRTDDIVYYGTNDTTEDKLDDELYLLDIAGAYYPTQVTDFFMRDENSITAYLYRRGLYEIDLERDFADTATAISKIYASLSGDYLDINHIKLLSVDFIDNAGSTSYRVSIDGGKTWKPIIIGEQVFFTDPGYQIAFAIDMFEGSTPIISGFELEYSAYKDIDKRGLILKVDDEPDEVVTNTEFSFSVSALDELLNPLTQDQVVTLQLRSSTTNDVIETFNVSSTLIQEGEGTVEIENAKAPVVGYHYIYAQSDTASATSDDINFIAPATVGSPSQPVTLVPALTFSASKYQIYKGEETILNWTSSNLSNLTLSSDNDNLTLGNVVLNGTKAISLDKTTEFTLSGTGSYGNLTSKLIVEVLDIQEESVLAENEILLPEIIEFDATILEKVENGWLTEISWKVINADDVVINDIGDNLALEGSAQIIITDETTFVITASNDYGQATASDTVDPTNDLISTLYAGVPFLTGAILTAAVSVFLVPLSATFSIDLLTKFGVLFGVFRIKKKSYWGFVFDAKTSNPIPFAVINAYFDGQLVNHTISDLDGKYGLLVENAGTYTIEVKASGYKKYSNKTQVEVSEGSTDVVEDIALHKKDEKQNFVSNFRNYHKKEIAQTLFFVLALTMVGGFVYTVIITTQYPNAVNFLLLGLYGVFFTINLMSLLLFYARTAGKVLDKETNNAIKAVSVRFYKDKKQVGIFLTNSKGLLKINLSAGKYEYMAHKSGYKQSRMRVINVNEKGYLSDDITLEKI